LHWAEQNISAKTIFGNGDCRQKENEKVWCFPAFLVVICPRHIAKEVNYQFLNFSIILQFALGQAEYYLREDHFREWRLLTPSKREKSCLVFPRFSCCELLSAIAKANS
jgi:hypothetical protein